MSTDTVSVRQEHPLTGVLYAVGAFATWGVLPLYFQMLKHVSPGQLLAQRVWWTFLTVILVQLFLGRLGNILQIFRSRKIFFAWLASSLLIGSNWLIFVYAATHGQVLETSLGYFICPLFNVVLGAIVFRERLTRPRILALALATLAVTILIVFYARLPIIALSLAATFAAYGLLRKKLDTDPLTGLLADTLFLVPAAFFYLVQAAATGSNTFVHGDNSDRLLLYLLAPITLIPLGFFAAGAQRLQMATLGFLQYLTPTISFLCAILLLREPFTTPQLIAFVLIWAGLLIYSAEAIYRRPARTLPLTT